MGNNHFGWQTIRDAGNLAISRARDFRHWAYVTMRGTTNPPHRSCKNQKSVKWNGSSQSRKSPVLTVQQRLYLFQAVNAIAVFKN